MPAGFRQKTLSVVTSLDRHQANGGGRLCPMCDVTPVWPAPVYPKRSGLTLIGCVGGSRQAHKFAVRRPVCI